MVTERETKTHSWQVAKKQNHLGDSPRVLNPNKTQIHSTTLKL